MKLKFRLLLEHEEKMKLGFNCWHFSDLVIQVWLHQLGIPASSY
jgi:hypothetical protein